MSEAKLKAVDHESYITYSLIGFLIPLVGFIIGSIMLTKDDKLDKKLGEHTVVISVFGVIAFAVLWGLWIFHSATATPLMNP